MITNRLFKKSLPMTTVILAVLASASLQAKDMIPHTSIKSIAASSSQVRGGEQVTIRASVVYDHDLRDSTPRVPLRGKRATVLFKVFGTSYQRITDSQSGIATLILQVPQGQPPRAYVCGANVLESPFLHGSVQLSTKFSVVR